MALADNVRCVREEPRLDTKCMQTLLVKQLVNLRRQTNMYWQLECEKFLMGNPRRVPSHAIFDP